MSPGGPSAARSGQLQYRDTAPGTHLQLGSTLVMMTNEQYLAVLTKHKITVPPELLPIRRLDYHMSSDGWYLQVECGDWYWYDNRTARWFHAPMGRSI